MGRNVQSHLNIKPGAGWRQEGALQAQELQQKDRKTADTKSCTRASEGKLEEVRVLRV